MKHNNLAKIQKKISERKYDHAIALFKGLTTHVMYENFDRLINGYVLKHVFQKRNSDVIYDALKTQRNFYFHSYNSEILWNLLLLKKITVNIKEDLKIFEDIEKNIFLNNLDGLYEKYQSTSEVAKKSHKGIELLVHLNQLKLIEELPEYKEDSYKKACIEQYISKIQFFVENSTLKERIHADLREPSFAEYFIYKVTQEFIDTDRLVIYAHIDRSYNDIDYYEDIINYLLETSMRGDLHSTVIRAIEDVYQITEDKRLLTLIYSNKKNYDVDQRILDRQMYFEYDLLANYKKVLEITKQNIEEESDDYCSYLFYLKSSVLTNSDEVLFEDNLVLGELFKHFKIIFNLSGDRVYYHAYTCLRLLDQYKVCRWSRLFSTYIIAYLDKFSETNFRYFNFVYGFNYNFNPLRSYFYKNKKYSHYYPNCISYNALIEEKDNYELDDSIVGKVTWIKLLEYYRSNFIDFAYEANSSVEKILYFHLNYIYINKLIENKRTTEAVELTVNQIVEYTEFYNLHPFEEIFEIVVNDDFIDPIYKLIIIYYKIYAFDPEENKRRDLISNARILLESIIIKYEDDDRINEFLAEYSHLDPKVVNFFLCYVWQTEFMKNTLVYESINEIQEERINICKKLIELDPNEKSIYLSELQEKVKTLEINKTSNLIHSSKVFVDVNSVKRACLDRLDKSFESFKQLRSHSKDQQTIFLVRDSNDDLTEEGEDAELIQDFDTSKIINFNGYKFKALKIDQRSLLKFKHIISDVTNEFLMGATGLNSYLSTGIRHGILRNHLRNPIEKEQLLPSYLDRHLSNKIVDTLENREVIYELLQKFSDEIDNTIDFITERLIQISISYEFAFLYDSHDKFSRQSVNLNMFNYVFTFDEAEMLISKGKADLAAFIDDLINLLWLKTDACLLRMRHVLATTIKQRFREIFRQLIESLIKVGESEKGDLINSIVSAESNFFRIFQEAQQWFNKNNVYQLPELQLSRCVEISKNIITRTIFSLKDWEGLELKFNNDPSLSGRYVSDLVYMFLDLFNNAYQHSKLEPNDLKIELNILHDDRKVLIDFRNNLNLDLIDLESTRSKLTDIRESIRNNKSKELAQKDTNSGLHKINNRICNELLFTETSLNFELDEQNSQFIVKIEFTINRS